MERYKILVEGMKCNHCEKHVEDFIAESFKAKKIKASFKDGLVTFESKDVIDETLLKNGISELGFKVISINKD